MNQVRITIGAWIWHPSGNGAYAVNMDNGTSNHAPFCRNVPCTTSCQLLLIALNDALTMLDMPTQVEVITDNEYLYQVIDEWIHDWKKNGWTTKSGKSAANLEELQQLEQHMTRHVVTASIAMNEPNRSACQELTANARAFSYPSEKPNLNRYQSRNRTERGYAECQQPWWK